MIRRESSRGLPSSTAITGAGYYRPRGSRGSSLTGRSHSPPSSCLSRRDRGRSVGECGDMFTSQGSTRRGDASAGKSVSPPVTGWARDAWGFEGDRRQAVARAPSARGRTLACVDAKRPLGRAPRGIWARAHVGTQGREADQRPTASSADFGMLSAGLRASLLPETGRKTVFQPRPAVTPSLALQPAPTSARGNRQSRPPPPSEPLAPLFLKLVSTGNRF